MYWVQKWQQQQLSIRGGSEFDLEGDLDILEGPGEDTLGDQLVLPHEAGVHPSHLRGEQRRRDDEVEVPLKVTLPQREAALEELRPAQLLLRRSRLHPFITILPIVLSDSFHSIHLSLWMSLWDFSLSGSLFYKVSTLSTHSRIPSSQMRFQLFPEIHDHYHSTEISNERKAARM